MENMTNSEKAAMFLGVLFGLVFGFMANLAVMGNDLYNNGLEHGRVDTRSRGCASACERRGTEMEIIHVTTCLCRDGQSLTLDYGMMYHDR